MDKKTLCTLHVETVHYMEQLGKYAQLPMTTVTLRSRYSNRAVTALKDYSCICMNCAQQYIFKIGSQQVYDCVVATMYFQFC